MVLIGPENRPSFVADLGERLRVAQREGVVAGVGAVQQPQPVLARGDLEVGLGGPVDHQGVPHESVTHGAAGHRRDRRRVAERPVGVELPVLHDQRHVVGAAGQVQGRLLGVTDEVHAGQPHVHLLAGEVLGVVVVPLGAGALTVRIGVVPTRARGEGIHGAAVRAGSHVSAVQVQGRRRGQLVDHVQLHGPSALRLDRRPRERAVVGPHRRRLARHHRHIRLLLGHRVVVGRRIRAGRLQDRRNGQRGRERGRATGVDAAWRWSRRSSGPPAVRTGLTRKGGHDPCRQAGDAETAPHSAGATRAELHISPWRTGCARLLGRRRHIDVLPIVSDPGPTVSPTTGGYPTLKSGELLHTVGSPQPPRPGGQALPAVPARASSAPQGWGDVPDAARSGALGDS